MPKVKGNPECELCDLHQSVNSVCIMGRGAIPSKVMIIGEAPGYYEDQEGRPFVGKSGQLINDLLERNKISRSEIYITNAVKCRPPMNKTPSAKSMKQCSYYLRKEFRIVQPEFVLLLGATAVKSILGKDKKITELRGQIINENGINYMATYHPAAVLRDERLMPVIQADFKRFFKAVNGIEESNEVHWELIETFEDFKNLIKQIKNSTSIVFDLETNSLKPNGEGKAIQLMGISLDGYKQYVIPMHHKESPFKRDSSVIDSMMEILQDKIMGKEIINHNIKFDLLWMRVHHGWNIEATFDTMIADYVLDENKPHGLKHLSSVIFGAAEYDLTKEEKTGGASLRKLAEYCALDVFYTRKLYDVYKEELKEIPSLQKLFQVFMMPVVNLLVDAEEHGVYVDVTKLDQVEKELRKQKKILETELAPYGDNVNWNSTDQLAKILFSDLKLPVLEFTPKGKMSTNESVLQRLREHHPLPEIILKYRGVTQFLNMFIDGWKPKIHSNQRMYPSFKQLGTVTGRLSSEDPNLQQTPRNKKIRSLITAPTGYTLVEFDLSQIELRIAAMYSNEENMMEIFNSGLDIHSATAESVSGVKLSDVPEDERKEHRKKAKPVNFGFLYGMGANKFQIYARDNYGVDFTKEESYRARKKYFNSYPRLLDWHEKQRQSAYKFGYVESPIGRRRNLPEIYSRDEGKKAEAERQAINSPVQSFASDLNLMIALAIREKYTREEVGIVGFIHDANLIEVRDDMLEEVIKFIQETAKYPPLLKEFDVIFTVPIEADYGTGAWGSK